MKIIDCTTYYSEDLMLDVRFNILNNFVDKFIITESKYSHSGKKNHLILI
jgi:beta-1,4-mannosyl-glycoprotein beta-1,4-N-acetylglucosaminyltransferase